MMTNIANSLLKEFDSEVPATDKCLERISESTWEFKPHTKSMTMGYLALLVAEIPLWITVMIEKGDIDFVTFKHAQPKTREELLAHFRENVSNARNAFQNSTEADIHKTFYLRAGGKEIFHASIANILARQLITGYTTVDN